MEQFRYCCSGDEGEFCGDNYGGVIIMVKGLRIANQILVGLGLRIVVDRCGGPWVFGDRDR